MVELNEAPQERHVFALMAMASRSGAATSCVGAVGLELCDGTWSERAAVIRALVGEGDGGWQERLDRAREASGITLDVIAFWEETANGILWDIHEVPPHEYASAGSLDAALDVVLEDVLVNPDPDPDFIDWVSARG